MDKKNENYYAHKRTDLLGLVPAAARNILSVGCGSGLFGKEIKRTRGDAKVVGVEIDAAACACAAENLDKVIRGDIETVDIPFEGGYFDCIITGDVLEHLRDPWAALTKLRYFLKDDGVIVASIPNIRYYKALIRLFLGYWDYTEEGIFDKTHLRFFCLVNIKEMFAEAGFHLEKIERNKVAARGFRILNYICFGGLKEFLTYQYYVVAKKTGGTPGQPRTRRVIQF